MATTSAKGPPQNDTINPTKVAVKGDVLETQEEFLESAPMMVEWSQKWITRNEKYYFVVVENTSQGDFLTCNYGNHLLTGQLGGDKTRLFINEKALAEFKHNPAKDGKIVFKLDEGYQYGQANKEGKDRFLVLHNKNNTPYQVANHTVPISRPTANEIQAPLCD